jgi:hypothetical protein
MYGFYVDAKTFSIFFTPPIGCMARGNNAHPLVLLSIAVKYAELM